MTDSRPPIIKLREVVKAYETGAEPFIALKDINIDILERDKGFCSRFVGFDNLTQFDDGGATICHHEYLYQVSGVK